MCLIASVYLQQLFSFLNLSAKNSVKVIYDQDKKQFVAQLLDPDQKIVKQATDPTSAIDSLIKLDSVLGGKIDFDFDAQAKVYVSCSEMLKYGWVLTLMVINQRYLARLDREFIAKIGSLRPGILSALSSVLQDDPQLY